MFSFSKKDPEKNADKNAESFAKQVRKRVVEMGQKLLANNASNSPLGSVLNVISKSKNTDSDSEDQRRQELSKELVANLNKETQTFGDDAAIRRIDRFSHFLDMAGLVKEETKATEEQKSLGMAAIAFKYSYNPIQQNIIIYLAHLKEAIQAELVKNKKKFGHVYADPDREAERKEFEQVHLDKHEPSISIFGLISAYERARTETDVDFSEIKSNKNLCQLLDKYEIVHRLLGYAKDNQTDKLETDLKKHEALLKQKRSSFSFSPAHGELFYDSTISLLEKLKLEFKEDHKLEAGHQI